MDIQFLAPDKKNLNCAGCGQQEVLHLCPCKQSGLYLCDGCVTSHVSKYRGKSHNILPIQTLNYYKIPGYIEAFKERTNEAHDKAIEELRCNSALVDDLKSQFSAEAARLTALLAAKTAKITQDFDQIKRFIESEALAGIQEMHQKVFEPSPDLTSPIAKALWRYSPGTLRLISCESEISSMFAKIDEYVSGLKVILKVEFGGGGVLRETHGGSDVVVVPNSHILTDGYVGQRNKQMQKHGYGKEAHAGEVFEGCWKNDVKTVGKHTYGRRVTIGDFRKCEKNWEWGVFNLFCVVFAVWIGAVVGGGVGDVAGIGAIAGIGGMAGTGKVCEPEEVTRGVSIFEEGPRNTTQGWYWGDWNSDNEKHGYGQLVTLTREIYTGHWSFDKMDGKGRLVTPKGEIFDGDWSNGQFHGYGSIESSNGNLVLGQFCAGVLCGLGLSYTKNANRTYIGEFEQGFPHGKGSVFYFDMPLHSGAWRSGVKTGFGVEYLKDKLCYGTFFGNHLQGDGTCLTAPAVVYSGNWDNGKKSGNGTLYYPSESQSGHWVANQAVSTEFRYNRTYKEQFEESNERSRQDGSITIDPGMLDAGWLISLGPIKREYGVYFGQINDVGQRHGYGFQNYSDGSSYEGYWKNDVRDGKGKMLDGLGRMFEGDWIRNTFTGCGIMAWSGGIRQGTWINKKMEGLGMERRHTFVTIGEYANNSLNGLGARFDEKGSLSIGSWVSDKLQGRCIELYRNGDLYSGFFDDGVRSGNGTYLWKSGDLYIGEFNWNSRNGQGRMIQGLEIFDGFWTNGTKHGEGLCRYCSSIGEKCRFDSKP